MKYKVGDRFRYFSIVGREVKPNDRSLLECLCDCGIFFTHPVKNIGRKIELTCNSNYKCELWAEMNKEEIDWPIDHKKRDAARVVFRRDRGDFKKVVYKSCRTCNRKDLSLFFHPSMQQTCFKCLGSQTPEEFRSNQGKRWRNTLKNKIKPVKKVIGGAQDKDGYIYIMYSPSMNLYKIGVAKNPFIRVKTIAHAEYRIKDLKLLCIGNPVGRSFDCEGYIHKMIRKYLVKYIKPCGGITNELFSCTLITAANIFLSVCQEAYWLDDNTRDLVDFNMTKIGLDEVNEIRKQKRYLTPYALRQKDKVCANKMLKDMYKRFKFKIVNLKGIKCYASGDREDGKFEAMTRAKNTLTSLGVFDTWAEAYEHQREFAEFYQREWDIQYRFTHKERLREYSAIYRAKNSRILK